MPVKHLCVYNEVRKRDYNSGVSSYCQYSYCKQCAHLLHFTRGILTYRDCVFEQLCKVILPSLFT